MKFTAALLTALPFAARAHDGHGLFGAHWHASDVFGFVAACAAVGLAVWLGRGGK